MGTGFGAAFIAVAVRLVPVALRHQRRHAGRVPRPYPFDGGMVPTRPSGIVACPWGDVRLVEYTESVSTAQGAGTQPVTRLRLDRVDGGTLCAPSPALPVRAIVGIALAGGARAQERTAVPCRAPGVRHAHLPRTNGLAVHAVSPEFTL